MPHTLKTEDCDLDAYPLLTPSKADEFTLGDLHGNALYLMYFLLKVGVLQIDQENYQTFAEIYHKPQDEINESDFEKFRQLIATATVVDDKKIRFLGDMLADRGKNDYFTLKILELLHKGGVDFNILLSNHGAEFLFHYEQQGLDKPYVSNMGETFCASLTGLSNSIAKGHVSKAECDDLVKKVYRPRLVALDYTRSRDDVAVDQLYSHAPVDLALCKRMATELDLVFHDATSSTRKASIDAINQKMSEIIQKGELHLYFQEVFSVDSQTKQAVCNFFVWPEGTTDVSDAMLNVSIAALQGDDKERFSQQFPVIAKRGHVSVDIATGDGKALTRLIWNRDFTDLHPETTADIFFIHGHDSVVHAGHWTLDGMLGKGEGGYQGQMLFIETSLKAFKRFQSAKYKIRSDGEQRILEIIPYKQSGRFASSDGRDEMSLPLPKDADEKEIIERLKQVYAFNSTPDKEELLRIVSLNEYTSVEYEVKKSEGGEGNTLVVTALVETTDGKVLSTDMTNVPYPDSKTQTDADGPLQALYACAPGKSLKPTAAQIAALFSPVFKKGKHTEERVKGKVEPSPPVNRAKGFF